MPLIIGVFFLALTLIAPNSLHAQTPSNPIGIRPGVNTYHEFYDTVTGDPILLRGNSYIRVKQFPNSLWNLSDFVPGEYNHEARSQALTQMKADGYNIVRFFIDEWYIVDGDGTGLDDDYLSNLADFIRLCQEKGLYAEATFRRFPHTPEYRPPNTNPQITGAYHEEYLIPTYLTGKQKYINDVISSLISKNTPLGVVIWAIDNEPYFESDQKPLTLSSGTLTTTNGKTYDLSSPQQKELMMDENTAFVMDQVRQTIKTLLPSAIVGMNTYSPHVTTPPRLPRTSAIFALSQADYVGINIYADPVKSYTDEISALGIGNSKIPVIASEYGALVNQNYPTIDVASNAIKNLQIATCNSPNFHGWIAYEWDTFEYDHLNHYWHVTEADGSLNKAVAPKYRANPCTSDPIPIIGSFDSLSATGTVAGWVYDPQNNTDPGVNFYLDSPYPNQDWSNMIGSAQANQSLPNVRRNLPWITRTNVGFTFKIPDKYLTDGISHVIYAQSTDQSLDGQVGSYLLPGSGKAVPQITHSPKIDWTSIQAFLSQFTNIFDYSSLLSSFGQ